jgi:glycosyltransferase involved in cell wall biosynthesis
MASRGKVTVVHVAGQLDMGGMEKLLVEFARHADRSRFDLHFITLGKLGAAAAEIEALGWPVATLGAPPGLNPWLVVPLARAFRRLRADVVHTHNTRALLYAAPTARLAGVRRVVHTCHGQRLATTRRQLMAFRVAARAADRVVCVSRHSAGVVRAEGVSPRRVRTLWNGIDPGRFRGFPPGRPGPVVAVGRLSPEKDFETLVRAAALAARQDPTFRLELAGDGACAPDLRQLAADQGPDPAVRLLGQVQDIPALLGRASLFALSSLTEGVSLAILEAMASGLPVVATRVGGNPEVVADGRTGLLVPAGDPAALAAALLDLWRDPARRRTMGAAGRERVDEVFNISSMIDSYQLIYTTRNDLPRPPSPPAW